MAPELALPAWMPTWLPVALLAASVAMLLASPVAIARLPRDHFSAPVEPWRLRSGPWIAKRVARNALGALLAAAGVAMLVLPGQGLLTILVGLSLTDLPGRRRAERWIVTRPTVWAGLQKLRAFAGADPFVAPE